MKYLASYEGVSYGSMDQECMKGFPNLLSAMQFMRDMQAKELQWYHEYREDSEGVYRFTGRSTIDGAVSTPRDFMDVCYAIPDGDGYTLGDWAYRITVGPRGGIRSGRA